MVFMRSTVTRMNHTRQAKFRKAFSYQGIFARVAKQLGLTRTHVYYVATGVRQSKRVEAALLAEINRIESSRAA